MVHLWHIDKPHQYQGGPHSDAGPCSEDLNQSTSEVKHAIIYKQIAFTIH